MSESKSKAKVRQTYGGIATATPSDQQKMKDLAKAFGYAEEDLFGIPDEANMGLSCGNPIAMAGLREGEVVVDLGSGGGFDCFQAAKKVGPKGQVIGIDMTPEMIEKATRLAKERKIENVRFVQAELTDMPLDPNSVDCIISNCVITLVPDKRKAVREMGRVLKPGGRLALSDIVRTGKPFPVPLHPLNALSLSVALGSLAYFGISHAFPLAPPAATIGLAAATSVLTGFFTIPNMFYYFVQGLAGMPITAEEYERMLSDAGLSSAKVVPSGTNLNELWNTGDMGDQTANQACGSCDLMGGIGGRLMRFVDLNKYVYSGKVWAKKDH